MKRREQRSTRLLFEELEPRILHSADLAVLLPPAALMQVAEIRLVDDTSAASGAGSRATEAEAAAASFAPREIAIVDAAVPDYHDLVDDIRANSSGRVDVFILDGATSGLDQISQILASQHDVAAIHLISHGTDGAIQLGSAVVDRESLKQNAAAVAGWGAALSADADILLYGCDVAFDAAGRSFVDALASLTGADVAASADRTGSSLLGGNWALEYSAGAIETSAAPSAQAQARWAGTLAIAPVITLPGAAPSYTENGAPILIDATATVTDADSVTFNTGTLTVDFSANGTAADRLAIRNQGTGAGEIGVSGVDVTYEGTIIGSYAGGGGTTPLVVTFNAGSTPAAAQALLRNITFENVSDAPSTLARTVRFVLVDETGGASAPATRTIDVVAVNDAPTASNLSAAESYTEDTPLDLTDIVVGDVDSASVTATLTLSNAAAGSLNTATSGAVTSTYSAVTGVWSASGAIADVNTLLAGLTFTPAPDFAGSFTIATSVSDGAAAPVTGTKTMTATAVNDAPVLSGTRNLAGINQNATANGGTLVSDLIAGRVADADAAALAGIAVTSVNNANGTWEYSRDAGGNWTSFGTPTGSSAMLLAADASTYVRFVPNANWVGTVAPGLTFRAWDQTAGTAGTSADTTANGGATAFSAALQSASVTVHAYPIVFSGSYLENFSSLGTSGTQMTAGFRAMVIAGSGATYDAANPITAAAIAAATASNQTLLVWNPGDPAAQSQSQLFNGGSIGDAANRVLMSGAHINAASVIELAMMNTTGSPLATISFGYDMKVLADGAAPQTEAGELPGYAFFYSLTGGTTAAEWIAVPSLATTMSTVGDVQSVAATLSFATPLASNATMYFRWADDNFPQPDADYGIDNVSVQRVNNAPALSGIESASIAYVENAAATPVTSTLTIADIDNVNLTGATVTVAANYAGGQDILAFTNQNGITGSWSAATGVLSLSGSATLANYQAALRSVTYADSSDTPSTLTRTISFVVSDGADSSAAVTRDIGVTSVNDSPVMAGTNDMAGINRNPTSNPGTLVADLLAGHVTDADTGAVQGIAVTAVDNTNGAWQYSTDGGSSWTAFGTPGATTARLLAADVATFVRLVPNANYSGTVANGVTFRAWDQSTGVAAGTGDTTASGGATAFSAATASASITVTASNTAPTLTGSNNLTAVNEDAAANGGTLVSALIAGFTSDADPGALSGIAVTAVDNTHGAWQYSLDSGGVWNAFGSPAATTARLLAADASTYVRFVPSADWNGTVNGGITFRAWDRSTGVAGATADTSGVAGTFRDNFQTASYANNDGTLAWTGSWIETDSQSGGAAGGRFEIMSGVLVVQAGNVGDNIYREANLSGATGATLSFAYGSNLKGNASLHVQVSSDGGANYTTLAGGVFNASTNTYAGSRSFDITSSIASNTMIRWIVVGSESASDSNLLYVDNIQITASARNGSGTAFSTATAASAITVDPVNDAPVRTAGSVSNLTVLEDAAATSLGLGALAYAPGGGSDEGAQSVTYTVTALPAAALGAVTLTDGTTAVTANTSYTLGQLQGMKFKAAANAAGGPSTFSWTAADSGGTANGGVDTLNQSMTVSVTSINDAPAGSDRTITTAEDTAYTFSAADFGFTDSADTPANSLSNVRLSSVPGAGTLALSGVAVSAGQFVSVAAINAGNLRFTPAAHANGAGYASFTFQVQDDGGVANGGVDTDAIARTMTVNVTSVNDAPSGASRTVTTLEDTAYTFGAADFGFTDPADSNALLNVKIATLPAAGSLTLSGVTVASGQFVSAASITAGNLRFNPAANANGAGYASFTFQVQDDGGVANGGVDTDPTPRTVTVDVTAVNDAPAGADKTVTTLEDTAYTFSGADFGFTDIDSNALLNVKIATLPAAGSLTLSGAAVTAGQFVSAPSIAAGDLSFMPAANANGAAYASFTFQVQDDGGVANGGIDVDGAARTMTVSVTSVNDAPAGADRTVATLEDTRYTFTAADFGFTDPNDANALLAVRISTVPAAGGLTLAGAAVTSGQVVSAAAIAAGDLRFVPAADVSGAPYASFTFQVQDDGGTGGGGVDFDAAPNTITVSVTPVNDAPAASDRTVTVLEDGAYTFSAADFGFADPRDAAGAGANALSAVRIATLPPAGTLALDFVPVSAGQLVSLADLGAGKLIFIPAANANGAAYASFTFQVKDDGGVANGGVDLDATARTMRVDVTPVNDAPAGADNAVTTREDVAYTFSAADFGFSDANDANALLNVKVMTLPAAGTLTLAGVAVTSGQSVSAAALAAGDLRFTPTQDQSGAGYASFTFEVQDDGGTTNGGVDTDPVARRLTVNVTSVNDAPAGSSNTVATLEDTAYVFRIADFGFTDAADSNALLNVKIVALPGAGSLTLNGVAVASGQSVSAAVIAAGALRFDPAPDANGAGYASFTFQVQDDGGVASGGVDLAASASTMTVDVTPVNDAPAGADASVAMLEDAAYVFRVADFGFADRDGNALFNVKIGALPAAGRLTLAGVALTAGQVVSAAGIAAGDLVFTPLANASGAAYASVTFQVQDDGGTANAGADLDPIGRTMTMNVISVNDAPAGAHASVSTREDTAYTFAVADFGFTDAADPAPNALLNVRIGAISGAGTFTLGGVAVTAGQVISAARIQAGELQFAPGRSGSGTGYATITFRLQDDGGVANGGADTDPASRTLTVNVVRTHFPADATPPVFTAEPPVQQETPAAASEESTAHATESRARSTLAKIAASLSEALAQTRLVAGNDIDAQVSELAPAPQREDDVVLSRSATSSVSARADGNATVIVAPDLSLDAKPEAARLVIVPTVGAGARPAAATAAEESSGETDPRQQAHAVLTIENGVRASAIIVSAGLVSWTLQGAGLIASLLTSAPAWRHLDPMPVLAPEEEKPDWGENDRDAQREEAAADSLWRIDADRRAVS